MPERLRLLAPWYRRLGALSSAGQTIQVGQVTETDLAQIIAWAPKHRLVGQIAETDLAQAIGRVKVLTVGQLLEMDLAQAITWAPKHRLVAQALETDLAQAVTVGGGGAPGPGDEGRALITLTKLTRVQDTRG